MRLFFLRSFRPRWPAFALLTALLLPCGECWSQTIQAAPRDKVVAAGQSATFSVVATGAAPLSYQWQHNGLAITGATTDTLALANLQPADAGIYAVTVTSAGASVSAFAVLGLSSTAKVIGAGVEVGSDIRHPSGNIYDQVLLQGAAATITADPGQVTRLSYVDLDDDIVQVEFGGAGALTLVLDNPSGPAAPTKYNQPTVAYMKGHASLVIAGADETTNVSVFSVGRANAVNQALFRDDVTYDGLADIASLAVVGGTGKFGGIRTANASYFAARGITGVYAPGVQFTGPVFVGNVNAFDAAAPMLLLGLAGDVRVTGGDLKQGNGSGVQVSGMAQLRFVDGSTSHGAILPAQLPAGKLLEGGADVTNKIAGAHPTAALYLAQLRPDPAAPSSTASGYATIAINTDGSASVAVRFSNLSATESGAYLRFGPAGDYLAPLPLGQVADRAWSFARVGALTTTDLIYALNTGNIYVVLNSATVPAGELRGSFVATSGSRIFLAPAAPPALAAEALTKPTRTDAARFLTQATFGPTSADIDALMAKGIPSWIDEQFALPATSHLLALRTDLAQFPNPPVPADVLGFTYHWADQNNRVAVWWKIVATSPDQLRQRVAFALSELFVISDQESTLAVKQEAVAKYYDLLGREAFGNFRQLLEDVSLSPIMGWWLSDIHNAKADPVKGTSPDENYAREVQQLFTIGLLQLQPDGTLLLDDAGQPIPTYNQEMISETAKVFTGWSFANIAKFTDAPPYLEGDAGSMPETNGWLLPMAYFDAFHDKTEKRVLSLQQVPLDRAQPTVLPANQSGTQDLTLFLDALFNHPNTGPFVSRQLIQRLVTSNPSPGYVYRVAQVFANDGTGVRGNLGAVVRAILTDYEARSPAVLGNAGYGKIKEPLLRATQFFRVLKAAAPNGRFMDSYFTTPLSDGWHPGGTIVGGVSGNFNQGPLRAATVFGFFSPDYAPPGALASAGLVAPELEITDASFAIRVPNALLTYLYRTAPPVASPPAPSPSPFLTLDFSEFNPLAGDPPTLVDRLNLLFCANQMSDATRTQILGVLGRYSGTARVQTAIHLTLLSQDSALQR